jgi:kynurenine formamidase
MDRDGGDYAAGARSPGGFRFAEDTVMLPSHSGTHIDALAHTWEGDELYNGHPAATVRSTRGAQRCGADKLVPIVTRGVLLDFAGDAPLEADVGIGPKALDSAFARAGVEPAPGDAVLLRTGWWDRHREDAERYFAGEPGLTREGAQWLGGRDPALVGADNYAVERVPSGEDIPFPVHLELLHRRGIPLAESLELGTLAETGRAVFLFVAAPLPLVGSLGAPVTPLAVL